VVAGLSVIIIIIIIMADRGGEGNTATSNTTTHEQEPIGGEGEGGYVSSDEGKEMDEGHR